MTELSLSGRQQQRYQGWYCCRWSLSRQPEITGIVDLRLCSGKWSVVKSECFFQNRNHGRNGGLVVDDNPWLPSFQAYDISKCPTVSREGLAGLLW